MQLNSLYSLLEAFQNKDLSIEQVFEKLRDLPFEQVGLEAHIDHHRALRTGFPEVIFAEGKTPNQIVEIFNKLADKNDQVLVTRLKEHVYQIICSELPNQAQYHAKGSALTLDKHPERARRKGILIITAGTADIPVAEEAAITADLMGNQVERIYDVGVSGLHRLLHYLPLLQEACVIVVIAGMEGALPSVVGGLVSAPIIAVPTSIGYGASFGGLAALLAMLNSCASGVAVVNIDNGYGAAVLASKINRLGFL